MKKSHRKYQVGIAVVLLVITSLFLYDYLGIEEARRWARVDNELLQLGGRFHHEEDTSSVKSAVMVQLVVPKIRSLTGVQLSSLLGKRKDIILKGPKSYDDFLEGIPPLNSIPRFIFNNVKITDATIANLVKQSHITDLRFVGCDISANNFHLLADLTKLKWMFFNDCLINNKILKDDLKKFRPIEIHFSKSSITEKNYKYLLGLKNIGYLSLYKANISFKAMIDLEDNMWNCSIRD